MLTSTSNNFTYMPVPVKSLWWGDLIFQMQNGCTMRLNPTEINELQFVVNIVLRWIKTCENDTKWTNCRWRVTKGTNFFMTYHPIDSNESFQTLHYPMYVNTFNSSCLPSPYSLLHNLTPLHSSSFLTSFYLHPQHYCITLPFFKTLHNFTLLQPLLKLYLTPYQLSPLPTYPSNPASSTYSTTFLLITPH